MSHILIVEDEPIIRAALRRLLEKNNYIIDDAASVDESRSRFNLSEYDLIITDLRLPGAPGTDLIKLANTPTKQIPVLIMTSYASMKSAVEAMKMGAADYIAKPFNHEEMLSTIAVILQQTGTDSHACTQVPVQLGTQQIEQPIAQKAKQHTDITGNCEAMLSLFSYTTKVARTDATVLVLGESGTGKELVARSIHEQSSRAQAAMISVNCAAIAESLIESELFGHEKGSFTGANSSRCGLIEAANKGTLFLDEIGELPLEAQARLLRFLQEGEIRKVGSTQSIKVDVRLIAATHRNLKELARTGLFREDLYYRLYVMELKMPPLRERGHDIIKLAERFLVSACARMNCPQAILSDSTQQLMLQYSWPGNVRELENAIERAVILADNHFITPELLGLDMATRPSLQRLESEYSEQATPQQSLNCPPPSIQPQAGLSLDDYFQRFVMEHQGDMSETDLARKLGVSRKCLWERRQKLGIPKRPKG